MENVLPATVSSPLISDWYALMLQPWGQPLDPTLFYHPPLHAAQDGLDDDKKQERHNVDKAMMAQDVALVTTEVIWDARITSARAMGHLIAIWPNANEAVRRSYPPFRRLIKHVLHRILSFAISFYTT